MSLYLGNTKISSNVKGTVTIKETTMSGKTDTNGFLDTNLGLDAIILDVTVLSGTSNYFALPFKDGGKNKTVICFKDWDMSAKKSINLSIKIRYSIQE